jgi:hypothetical protein
MCEIKAHMEMAFIRFLAAIACIMWLKEVEILVPKKGAITTSQD